MITIPTIKEKSKKFKRDHPELFVKPRYSEQEQRRKDMYNTTFWQKMSRYYRSIHPLCECCSCIGKVVESTQVHHLVKFNEQPTEQLRYYCFENNNNMMSLCTECHQAIHKDHSLLTDEQLKFIEDRKQKFIEQSILNDLFVLDTNDLNV